MGAYRSNARAVGIMYLFQIQTCSQFYPEWRAILPVRIMLRPELAAAAPAGHHAVAGHLIDRPTERFT